MTANNSNQPTRQTKLQRVWQRLQAGEVLTVRDILAMGINRPTDIIWKLRSRGEPIHSQPCTNHETGETFVKYSLKGATA